MASEVFVFVLTPQMAVGERKISLISLAICYLNNHSISGVKIQDTLRSADTQKPPRSRGGFCIASVLLEWLTPLTFAGLRLATAKVEQYGLEDGM